jgi:hypothetical protein
MRESTIEKRLARTVKSLKGLCIKWTAPGTAGVPDRLVLLPGGRLVFVELKAPGVEPGPVQRAVHSRLRSLGFEVLVIDSKRGVDEVFKKTVDKKI